MSTPDSSASSSKRSSFSSADSQAPQFNCAETGVSTTSSWSTTSASSTSTAEGVLDDVLRRDFPKPSEDINVAEMIARAPQRHSLQYYVKNARDLETPTESKEQQSRKLAEAKQKLLEAKEELLQLSAPRP